MGNRIKSKRSENQNEVMIQESLVLSPIRSTNKDDEDYFEEGKSCGNEQSNLVSPFPYQEIDASTQAN